MSSFFATPALTSRSRFSPTATPSALEGTVRADSSRTQVADGPVNGEELDPATGEWAAAFSHGALDSRHGHGLGTKLLGAAGDRECHADNRDPTDRETSRLLMIIRLERR